MLNVESLQWTERLLLPGAIAVVLAFCATAQESKPAALPLVPYPASVITTGGAFALRAGIGIVVGSPRQDVARIATLLSEEIAASTGIKLPLAFTDDADLATGGIAVSLTADRPQLGAEGYELSVGPDAVHLRASGAQGLFYGVQTLVQLIPAAPESPGNTWPIPGCLVVDSPRYGWRGMHLDVGRHFMPVEFVKRYIDVLARHKMNVFHWHLTEDQGWRIQIRKYPKLTEVGAWRDNRGQRYGGFYTQEEIRAVVAYAAERFVTVVPEIEMPGHSVAALASYPEYSCTGGPFTVATKWGIFDDVYCAGNDATFEFLENVLTEVIELFPGPWVHVGGDECPKTRWKACAKCQSRIGSEKLADEHELQSWFIKRISRFLESKGKRLIGWDEILEGGLARNAAVMSWRGMKGGLEAVRMGHDVVMSPTSHCYFDYRQSAAKDERGAGSVIDLETVYRFEPTPPELDATQAARILGAQGNVWTEHMPAAGDVEFMALPRLCALAEVVWTPREHRDWTRFRTALDRHLVRLDRFRLNYRKPPPQ